MAEDKKDVGIPIDWHFPEGLITRYANNVIVQHTDEEFIISFFEILPPVLLGSREEVKEKFEEIKKIPANCVARIIVPANAMSVFVSAITDNWGNYLDKQSEGD